MADEMVAQEGVASTEQRWTRHGFKVQRRFKPR